MERSGSSRRCSKSDDHFCFRTPHRVCVNPVACFYIYPNHVGTAAIHVKYFVRSISFTIPLLAASCMLITAVVLVTYLIEISMGCLDGAFRDQIQSHSGKHEEGNCLYSSRSSLTQIISNHGTNSNSNTNKQSQHFVFLLSARKSTAGVNTINNRYNKYTHNHINEHHI